MINITKRNERFAEDMGKRVDRLAKDWLRAMAGPETSFEIPQVRAAALCSLAYYCVKRAQRDVDTPMLRQLLRMLQSGEALRQPIDISARPEVGSG